MAIKTVTLRTEVERAKVGGGAGQVSHRTATPTVLPSLGDYATGIAAFAKGMYDVGQGVREVGKAMRSINAKASKMQADNQAIDAHNFNQVSRAENDPAVQKSMREDNFDEADRIMKEKYPTMSRRTFGSYW